MAFVWPTKMAARVGASAAGSARPLWRSSVQLMWCLQERLILDTSGFRGFKRTLYVHMVQAK